MQNYQDFLTLTIYYIVYLDYDIASHTGYLFSECIKNYIHPQNFKTKFYLVVLPFLSMTISSENR